MVFITKLYHGKAGELFCKICWDPIDFIFYTTNYRRRQFFQRYDFDNIPITTRLSANHHLAMKAGNALVYRQFPVLP
jgi:hypothetical protein